MRTKPNLKTTHYPNGMVITHLPIKALGEDEERATQIWVNDNGEITQSDNKPYIGKDDKDEVIISPMNPLLPPTVRSKAEMIQVERTRMEIESHDAINRERLRLMIEQEEREKPYSHILSKGLQWARRNMKW